MVRRWVSFGILASFSAGSGFAAPPDSVYLSDEAIEKAGLVARMDGAQRNATVARLAETIVYWADTDREKLSELQHALQTALLLQCDPGVYETLSPEAIEAADNAIEHIVSFEEIHRGNDWEPLIYAYGFFNRDVTPEEIRAVGDTWYGLSEDERKPIYPTYVHAIDAVCKPLSMGPLTNGETLEAMGVALPLLKSCLTQPPAEGRAFHPPSHAVLVLSPMYDRWAEGTPEGDLLRKELGSRDEYIRLVEAQMVGSRDDRLDLPEYMYTFYPTSGMYIANALARMNAREAVPTLKHSLIVYEVKGARDVVLAYTNRALVALGDESSRTAFEKQPDEATLVWLCRNGTGETVTYASGLLGQSLQCEPAEALTHYFEKQLAAMSP